MAQPFIVQHIHKPKFKGAPAATIQLEKIVRGSTSKKQVVETQRAEESTAIAYSTTSLEASGSTEELKNQPKPADANLRGIASNHTQIFLGESGEDKGYPQSQYIHIYIFCTLRTLRRACLKIKFTRKVGMLVTKAKENLKDHEMDDVVEITLIGSSKADQELEQDDSDLESMSEDEISSVSGNDDNDDDDDDDDDANDNDSDKPYG
ncbi:hypothetical protein Tco_1516060 [Tanacetum coccineum]